MTNIFIPAIALLLLTGWAQAQVIRNGDCTVDREILRLPACALETKNGKLFVSKQYLRLFFSPAGRSLESRNPGDLASTSLPQGDWAYLNNTGLIVVRNVAVMDNGPNEFHHGLVRVTKNGKWGLADIHGKIVVPFIYNGMLDYQEGKGWPACSDCTYVRQGEYGSFQGGKWVSLDRLGKATLRKNDYKP